MWRPSPRRRAGRSDLRAEAALLDDRLRLVAQPIVHLATGEPVAAELMPLIARAPRDGSPVAGCFDGRAIGAVDIDAWVVQQAAYLAACGGQMHVTLSGSSAKDATFVFRVERGIDRAGADPRFLTFELSEAFAAQETPAATAIAHTLAGFGCSIAINDCALRYPSRDHIARIPLDYLKIDPWVVAGALDEPPSADTVAAIVEIAQEHGLETIAEGVYDQELRSLLRSEGVDHGQGFPAQRYFL